MKKSIFCFLFALIGSISMNAQVNHSAYLEAMGSGLFYSVNYDVRFDEEKNGFGSRVGIGVIKNDMAIPLQINYLLGKGSHKFEIGAGITTTIAFDNNMDIYANAALMYRYQNPNNGLQIRAGLSPVFVTEDENALFNFNEIYWIWPGVSVGYKF